MPGEVNFSIAIVGGGIGGLTCALSLAKLCPSVRVDVYEQAPEYKEIGAGVGIGVNAAKILYKIGVGKQVNAICGQTSNVWLSFRRFDDGKEIVTLYDSPNTDPDQIRQLPVHRAEFLDVLKDAIENSNVATLHVNKRCVKVAEQGDKAEVTFADGTSTMADLVIGCDGIHSVIRSQFTEDKPRYSGRIAFRGLVPVKDVESFWPLGMHAASWLGKDKHFLIFPISKNETLNLVAFVTKPIEELGDLQESWTATADRAEVEEAFKNFDPTIQKVVACMEPRPAKWLLNDRNALEQWVHLNGKLVLIGDAAHAMLPHQGAGAGQSIEDGYTLSRFLQQYLKGDNGSLEGWLNKFQGVRLPRAQKAQATARQAGLVYQQQGDLFEGKSYDDNLPEVAQQLKDRMKWIWSEDIDVAIDAAIANRSDT